MPRRILFMLFVITLIASALWGFTRMQKKASLSAPVDSPTLLTNLKPSAPDAPDPPLLHFTLAGLPGKMADAVQLVVRPRRALAALCPQTNGRFACILVEATGPEHYVELDAGLRQEDFPFLKQFGFVAPPPQTSRTMSIFRSVSKTAMNFHEELGDRMIVLMCPAGDWAALRIPMPVLNILPPAATAPSGKADPAKDNF